jgi:hypothetical protein
LCHTTLRMCICMPLIAFVLKCTLMSLDLARSFFVVFALSFGECAFHWCCAPPCNVVRAAALSHAARVVVGSWLRTFSLIILCQWYQTNAGTAPPNHIFIPRFHLKRLFCHQASAWYAAWHCLGIRRQCSWRSDRGCRYDDCSSRCTARSMWREAQMEILSFHGRCQLAAEACSCDTLCCFIWWSLPGCGQLLVCWVPATRSASSASQECCELVHSCSLCSLCVSATMAHQFADGIFTHLLALQRTCLRCCEAYVLCLQVSSVFLMMLSFEMLCLTWSESICVAIVVRSFVQSVIINVYLQASILLYV